MRETKREQQKKKNRRILAGMFAIALAACLLLNMIPAEPALAENGGCEITLTPSAPAADNGIADVYGYYNADSEISVDILVQADGKDAGVRRVVSWVTDGTEDADSAVEIHTLYEDPYPEKAEAEDAVSEAEEAEEEKPEEPTQEARPAEQENPVGSEETEEPEDTQEAEEAQEPEESEKSEDTDDGERGDAEESAEEDGQEDGEDDADVPDAQEESEEEDPAEEPDVQDKSEEDNDAEDPDAGEEPEEDSDAEEPDAGEEPEEDSDAEEPDAEEEPEEDSDAEESDAQKDAEEDDGENPGEEVPERSGEAEDLDVAEPAGDKEPAQAEAQKGNKKTAEPQRESGTESPKETHSFLESWEGSVAIDPARYPTGEVRLHVKATDSMGREREAVVRLDIDSVAPEVQITGVSDQHGYRDSVTPKVRFYDANFSDYEISLTRTRFDEADVDVTERFFPARELSEEGGELSCETIERIRDNDGIYTLRAKATDHAGNESETSAVFSVNRFGSVYVFDAYLLSLVQNGGGYVQAIEQDLVITEYNANRLMPQSLLIDITRDARPVTEVISGQIPIPGDGVSTGDSGWYEYQYTIDKENFASDGVYKISLFSEDEAGNTPDNVEATGTELLFRVDGTEPEVTGNAITDDNGALEQGENFSCHVYDTMGLASVEIYVDGELVDDAVTDFGEDDNNYGAVLSLPTTAAEQEVRVVATDRAGNIADTYYAAPAGVRAWQELFASPAVNLKQLAQEGIVLPVLVGAAIAAAVCLFLFGLRARRVKRK